MMELDINSELTLDISSGLRGSNGCGGGAFIVIAGNGKS